MPRRCRPHTAAPRSPAAGRCPAAPSLGGLTDEVRTRVAGLRGRFPETVTDLEHLAIRHPQNDGHPLNLFLSRARYLGRGRADV